MSQGDGFAGGFLAGAVFGGLVGGVIGALVTSRITDMSESEPPLLDRPGGEARARKPKRGELEEADRIEMSRRSLEDKIAQLNSAIDEVRLSLGNVNGNAVEADMERSPNLDL